MSLFKDRTLMITGGTGSFRWERHWQQGKYEAD